MRTSDKTGLPAINLFIDRTEPPDKGLDINLVKKFLFEMGFHVNLNSHLEIEADKHIISEYTPGSLKGLPQWIEQLYDGHDLARELKKGMPRGISIVFTSKLLLAMGPRRLHARTIVIDPMLAVISTTGIVEAPAKPKEYYIKIGVYEELGKSGYDLPAEDDYLQEIKDDLGDRYVDYGDPRISEVAKGLSLQGVYFMLWGEAFCQDPDCRLFDAHTHEEMIHSQIEMARLCRDHRTLGSGHQLKVT